MKGLIIFPEYIEMILAGTKVWEMRSRKTHIRGKIGLIGSGTGKVFGTVEIVDCIGPLSAAEQKKAARKWSAYPPKEINPKRSPLYAWVLANPKRYSRQKRYEHPQGAVTWVELTGRM